MNMQVQPQHFMQVMDPTGHTTVTWNPEDTDSINQARAEFRRLIRSGYQAFRMNAGMDGAAVVETKGERITEFDPEAGKVMMIPQLVGG